MKDDRLRLWKSIVDTKNIPVFVASLIVSLVTMVLLYVLITVFFIQGIETVGDYWYVLTTASQDLINSISPLQLVIMMFVSLVMATQTLVLSHVIRERARLYHAKKISIIVPIVIRSILIYLLVAGGHIWSVLLYNAVYGRFGTELYLLGGEVYLFGLLILTGITISLWYQLTHPQIRHIQNDDTDDTFFKRFE